MFLLQLPLATRCPKSTAGCTAVLSTLDLLILPQTGTALKVVSTAQGARNPADATLEFMSYHNSLEALHPLSHLPGSARLPCTTHPTPPLLPIASLNTPWVPWGLYIHGGAVPAVALAVGDAHWALRAAVVVTDDLLSLVHCTFWEDRKKRQKVSVCSVTSWVPQAEINPFLVR